MLRQDTNFQELFDNEVAGLSAFEGNDHVVQIHCSVMLDSGLGAAIVMELCLGTRPPCSHFA